MLLKAFAAGTAALALVSSAQAATITYTLVTGVNADGTASANSFVVYGQTSSGDNSGLAAFQFGLNGTILTTNIDAPLAVYTYRPSGSKTTLQRTVGFNLYVGSSTASSIRGAQDTATYDTNISSSTTQTVDLVYGVGQTSGDVSTRNESPFTYSTDLSATTAYSAPVLLADGTFSLTSGLPTLSYGNGNIFTSQVPFGTSSSGTVQTINSATLVNRAFLVPEPTSLAVIGLVSGGVLARRRKV